MAAWVGLAHWDGRGEGRVVWNGMEWACLRGERIWILDALRCALGCLSEGMGGLENVGPGGGFIGCRLL